MQPTLQKGLENLWRCFWTSYTSRLECNAAAQSDTSKRCVVCGLGGGLIEKKLQHHVFCTTDCQNALWCLNQGFQLGLEHRQSSTVEMPQIDYSTKNETSVAAWSILFELASKEHQSQTANTGVTVFDLNAQIAQLDQKRHILFTDARLQLAVQRLEPGESVAWEQHSGQHQFVRAEEGSVAVYVDHAEDMPSVTLRGGATDTAIIRPGVWHKLVNPSASRAARFYTVYTPPAHTLDEQAADDHEAAQRK